eukprot:s6924_g2.t1
MGKSLMSELLQLHAFAIALCGGAHLHTLKEFNRRFLRRCFERYPPESNLRSPSVAEAQIAEQVLWSQIATLFNEERWSLDAAIHEVVVLRNELHTQLMPRPLMPKTLVNDALRFRVKGTLAFFSEGQTAGASSPLASEALARGIPALPIDILVDSTHDLLQDCIFEQLLRLAFAGRFAFAHASPPCTEYSRLKLRPGPGPQPCRSPEYLRGLPSNDAAANLRVVRSRTILERCVQILLAVAVQ